MHSSQYHNSTAFTIKDSGARYFLTELTNAVIGRDFKEKVKKAINEYEERLCNEFFIIENEFMDNHDAADDISEIIGGVEEKDNSNEI